MSENKYWIRVLIGRCAKKGRKQEFLYDHLGIHRGPYNGIGDRCR